ncbi:MAG: hypothetical protein J0L75_07670 [Spirochaetes bacterium]|nr:hypothetical protein [Spirochaetota bacterium]
MAKNLLVPSLPKSALADKADLLFRTIRGYRHEEERNHHLRIYAFACHLLDRERVKYDRAFLYYIALLHEHSVARRHGKGRGVFAKSIDVLQKNAAGFGLDARRRRVLREIVWNKYRIVPPKRLTPEAVAFRRAIIIEISRGVVNFDLPTMQVLAVFKHFAWWAFDRKLVSWWMEMLRQAPFSIFVRKAK